MALGTYAELQASVASWINRTDLTTQIVDFIALAESAIAKELRLRSQITVTTLPTVAAQDYITLPADWLEFKYIKYSGEPLEYTPPDLIRWDNEQTGDLSAYSIEGDRLLLNPTPSAIVTVNIAYYAKVVALATTSTNWLLTKYPDIYLYKALANAYRFMLNEERAAYWDVQWSQEVEKAHNADKASTISGGPLRIRAR